MTASGSHRKCGTEDIFGMSADPMFSEVVRYNNAMPQYHVGHLELVAQIEAAQAKIQNLQLAAAISTASAFPIVSPVSPDGGGSGYCHANAVRLILSEKRALPSGAENSAS
ncbi:MAG: hypothetical protein U0936_19785 [Planctomycetaceae bacterium]